MIWSDSDSCMTFLTNGSRAGSFKLSVLHVFCMKKLSNTAECGTPSQAICIARQLLGYLLSDTERCGTTVVAIADGLLSLVFAVQQAVDA